MKNRWLFFFVLVIGCCYAFNSDAQFLPVSTSKDSSYFSEHVMFYNVENLFDCKDDSLINDDEFTPEGDKHWTYTRYRQKLENISKVIAASSGWEMPAVIGLCEIENQYVIQDLLKYSNLYVKGYRYVHYNSGDARGIDVGLLYNKNVFLVDTSGVLSVEWEGQRSPTRDILFVTGMLHGAKITFCVNHWPSRRGGKSKSDFKRFAASERLASFCDHLLSKDSLHTIVVMGDFNDTPSDKSLSNIVKREDNSEFRFINSALLNNSIHLGSHKYKLEWGVLDQILVSSNCVSLASPFKINREGMRIVDLPFLLLDDQVYGGQKPFRTYLGPRYIGGFSDHLPVVLKLYMKKM